MTRPQSNNAWTDPRESRVRPTARIVGGGYYGAYDANQVYRQNRPAGQYLYSGAYADPARSNFRNDLLLRNQQNHHEHRFHHYHPYLYTGLYYPYFYGGFFPGYDGSLNNAYSPELEADFTSSILSGNTPNDQGGSSQGGYWERRQAVESDESADDATLPPGQPANVGPENPAAGVPHARIERGPDSLVEAVQSELAKRGYFAGKVDSMYGESTREALQRFQADRKLNVTGRINEATLHALQLD